jgi:tRNA(fMet)-specific endonuclease VapC
MVSYMLDTDISSYIMKRNHPMVLTKLQTVSMADLAISVITKGELMFGVEVSPKAPQARLALEAYLKHVEVLDFPSEAAQHYAEIRATLKFAGTMIGANDLLIAAHARCLKLTLVTNNTREFSPVQGLVLENWTEPVA